MSGYGKDSTPEKETSLLLHSHDILLSPIKMSLSCAPYFFREAFTSLRVESHSSYCSLEQSSGLSSKPIDSKKIGMSSSFSLFAKID